MTTKSAEESHAKSDDDAVGVTPPPEPVKVELPKADSTIKAPEAGKDPESHTVKSDLATVVIEHAISDDGTVEVLTALVYDPATGAMHDHELARRNA